MNLEIATPIVIGIVGLAIAYLSFRHSQRTTELEAIRQYFQQGDSAEYIKARDRVLNGQIDSIDSAAAAQVASFYHFWGLMTRKRYLPLWVFDGSSGYVVVDCFDKLSQFIKGERNRNPDYAEHFEWLRNCVRKKGYARPSC